MRPPQIEIAIGQAEIFIVNLCVERERQVVGLIEDAQFRRDQLNCAGRELRIFRSRHTRRDSSAYLDDVFAPQMVRLTRDLGILFRTKDNLR